MKRWIWLFAVAIFLQACSGFNNLGRVPTTDRTVDAIASRLNKTPNDTALQLQLKTAYANAVNFHLENINTLEIGNKNDKWERVMNEYAQLEQLGNNISIVTSAAGILNIQGYATQYALAKQNATESLYSSARDYLDNNDRQSALTAYNLLNRANKLTPGYKDVKSLLDIADQKSRLDIVINPVNYYSHPFAYYGLNNDYVQYQFINDLRYQLGSAKNVRVFTDQEAFQNHIYPDRVVDIGWEELYMPVPIQSNISRQVSKQIITGYTTDKKPIYSTVYATLYITQKIVQARGTLTCRITDPATNRTLMYENFPGGYNWKEEYATYRGDSRALDAYDWALVNNSNYNDPTRNSLFNEVLRQVYPQLISRIKNVTWYS